MLKQSILFRSKSATTCFCKTLILSSLLLGACSKGEETTGITTTENTISVNIQTAQADSIKAYLYSEDSPFLALDSVSGNNSFSFSITDTSLNYRVSAYSLQQGAISASLKANDSLTLTLKEYETQTILLKPATQTILTIQGAYASPTMATGQKDEYTIALLSEKTLLEFQTTQGKFVYQLEKQDNLHLEPVSEKESLNFEVTSKVFDYSLWKAHYDFKNWTGEQDNVPAYHSDQANGVLSAPLTGKSVSINGFKRQVLNIDQDAYFYTSFPTSTKIFAMAIVFKTDLSSAGLFQLTSTQDRIANGSNTWSAYLLEDQLTITGLNPQSNRTFFTTDSKHYKKGQWNTLLLQLSENQSLQIWLNGKLAGTGESKTLGQPTATYLTLGYVNTILSGSSSINKYFRGEIASASFYNRILSESEILALQP